MKNRVYPLKSCVLATNQRAVRISPSIVVMTENVLQAAPIHPPGASAFVNATRSASGLRRHMPVNSLTSFLPPVLMTSPGYRRPHAPAEVFGPVCSVALLRLPVIGSLVCQCEG